MLKSFLLDYLLFFKNHLQSSQLKKPRSKAISLLFFFHLINLFLTFSLIYILRSLMFLVFFLFFFALSDYSMFLLTLYRRDFVRIGPPKIAFWPNNSGQITL